MSAKLLGAYYTDIEIADRLTKWAVRAPAERVLDPSYGGGVFLRSAAARIECLGGSPSHQVFGVEIDEGVHARISPLLVSEFDLAQQNLTNADFFNLVPGQLQVDVVIGNPPFVRFHRFAGSQREMAMARAKQSGVLLSRLSSSWAPFIVHAMSMLKPGGRLAMVVPAELGYASYASAVLAHLAEQFDDVSLLSFRQKLFPDLSEDTFLVMADGYGKSHRVFSLLGFSSVNDLDSIDGIIAGSEQSAELNIEEIISGRERLVQSHLAVELSGSYRSACGHPDVVRLGDVARVGIGYVTGANDYFHLAPKKAREYSIPTSFLRKSVQNARALEGLSFTQEDWEKSANGSRAGYLVYVNGQKEEISEGLWRYIRMGEQLGIQNAYKCRVRKPWYAVPHVHVADAFLTYMSGNRPKLVANAANAVAPNTLHLVRLRPNATGKLPAILAGWNTSLARLSLEIEGHALGGGMLKIEPTEATRLRLPLALSADLTGLQNELDLLIRKGQFEYARQLADSEILVKRLGFSASDCVLFASAGNELAKRRTSKGVRV